MSRRLDTSSKTQTGPNHGQTLRSRGTSWTKPVWSPSSWIVMWKSIRRGFIRTLMGESADLEMSVRSSKTRIILIGICGWHQNGWKEAEYGSMWKKLMKNVDIEHIISRPRKFGMYSAWMQTKWNNCRTTQEDVWFAYVCWSNWQSTGMGVTSREHWSVVPRHGRTCSTCVERYCELANKKVVQLYKVSSPCLDDHQFRQEELESVGELSQVCSQIVMKCLCLARIGNPDILWSVNKLARAVTKCAQACDDWQDWFLTLITQMISDSIVMWETRHSIVDLVCFKIQTLLVILRTQNQPREESCVFLEVETFVPVSWMCKKQTSVSHSSTGLRLSLDAGLRMDGLPALDLWT